MNTTSESSAVGVFKDRFHANNAIAELHDAGVTEEHIGIATPRDEGMEGQSEVADGSHVGAGALAGTMTGLGLGALAGLGVLSGVIPVVGPVLMVGTLGVVASNAAAGAGVAGLVGALVGSGVPEHEATYYQGELEAGRTILTVRSEGRTVEANGVLRRCGAYDAGDNKAGSV